MLTPRASRSPVVILVIHRSRSWAAACFAWVLGRRASLLSARSPDAPAHGLEWPTVAVPQAR